MFAKEASREGENVGKFFKRPFLLPVTAHSAGLGVLQRLYGGLYW